MIFLGLGSNLGDREKNIISAIDSLAAHPRIRLSRLSSLYETAPVGKTDQPFFLNAVISLTTSLQPLELLDVCLEAERSLGRVRTERWGPRTIDIDLLIYDGVVCQSDRLTLPHPRLKERCFVLLPLSEIAPQQPLPGGLTAGELLTECPSQEVRLYKPLSREVR
ncbi:MAG: 2-amino-4-hydroxy-6-hydroxymethyldihydropteridine diphosphokinase [Negativicutes bacterium]|nr:2-amino-4-hydroxy-6-hydroxymethyldihydropteridine diphosphokinase [Negativicutes bacterium]